MNEVELVVFDMAGTTVKDRNHVGMAFRHAMASHGYNVSIEEVNPVMGYKKPVAIRMMLDLLQPDKSLITEKLIYEIHEQFVSSMISFYSTTAEIAALPNVEEAFTALREAGIKIALNTGFSRDIADVIVERLGWNDKIDFLIASDQVANGRPHADMINTIMQELDIVSVSNVAKVGDTEVDINEGYNAGCSLVIGITTGAFTREELIPYHPTHIIDNMSELIHIVLPGKVDAPGKRIH